jgi:hypothetical protein
MTVVIERFGSWEGAVAVRERYALGVDFAEGMARVVAVQTGGAKYGITWIGPLDLSDPQTAIEFVRWADDSLRAWGGYVHLFPADGDARKELHDQITDLEEEE